MKNRIAIRLLIFCALTFGIGKLASPDVAKATSNQVHVGVGIGVHHASYRHHRRRRHHRVGVGVGVHIH